MLNKILLRKIKFPLSLRRAFSFCHSRESVNPSSLSLRGAKQRSNLNHKGFSLIELMVAVAILAMAIFGIFHAYSVGFMGMADARDRTVATNYAQEAMENIKNMDFEEISSTALTPIEGTKFEREIHVVDNVEGSPNLKKVTVKVFWENRNGKILNIETSMLVNKIEFFAGEASKIILYVHPYNVIYPIGDQAYLTAVVKDAKGNTIVDWDKAIKFSVIYRSHTDEINLGYLEGGGDTVVKNPNKGIATTTFYAPSDSNLGADEQGLVRIMAEVEEAAYLGSDTVDIIITWGAVRIDLVTDQYAIKLNSSTNITASLVNAKGELVTAGEAEIVFNVSGEGALSEPLVRQTVNGQVSITLTASNTPGVATVTASASNLFSGLINIYVTGPPKYIYIYINPNYIYLDDTAEVTVILKDINGITVDAEETVYIDLSLTGDSVGQGNFNPSTISIGIGSSSGKSTFYPTGIGNGTIQAVDSAGVLTTGKAAIIIVDPLVADYIEVSAKPSSIEAGGDSPSIITAVIKSSESATVYNYSEPITFTTNKGSFSTINSGITSITLTSSDDNYQDGVAWVELYSNSGDTSGVASINVTSGTLTEGNTEVGFYVEADYITLNASPDIIKLFGVPNDSCIVTATIKDSSGNIVENYVGTVIFSIILGNESGQFIITGSAIVTVVDGQASIGLRSKCTPGDVVVRAVSTFGETEITSEPDNETIIVMDGSGRSIELISGSIWQPAHKKDIRFSINNTGIDLKIYNLQAIWGSSAKITEIKIDNIIVYSGSVSDGDIVNITPTILSNGEHEIYFTYNSRVDNKDFEIILNAEPDCELLEPINFST